MFRMFEIATLISVSLSTAPIVAYLERAFGPVSCRALPII